MEKENLKIKKISSTQPLSHKENYSRSNSVMIKLGAYIPNNDIENIDNGFYNQITYNRYLNKNFALEVGGGSIFTSAEGVFKNSSNNERTVSGDLYVYNIIFNLKAILPLPFGEIYAGIGPGLYLIYGDNDGTITFIDDNDTVFGGQVVAGINFDVNKVIYLGFEGQYIFTDDAEFTDGTYRKTFNIDGYNISGVIGFRF
jgi:opacity protein-like surface antigen